MAVKKIFSFFGSPGAGKGTLAQSCAEKLNFEILSVGNLCRQQILLKTDIGKKIEESLNRNSLISDELIVNMVNDWVLSRNNTAETLILDGFPRTTLQVKLFNDFLNRFLPKVQFLVINFEILRDIAFKRALQRLTCLNLDCLSVCSSNSEAEGKQRCLLCGSKAEKRKDDTPDNLEKRFDKFPEYKEELLSFYKKIGQPVENFDIEDKNIEDVFNYFVKTFLPHDKYTKEL